MRSLLKKLWLQLPYAARSFIKELWLNMPIATTRHVNRVYWQLQREAEATRSRIDVPAELILQFDVDKNTPEFLEVYDNPEPLVSICVATYNRPELLVNRTIKSLINQTYKNIEIIVVGDCCPDSTPEAMAKVDDPRVHFFNLPERGNYPPEGANRWRVAGTAPMNKGLDLSKGDFICHCDDDDEFVETKVEKLVAYMRKERPHFIWHDIYQELELNSYKWEHRKCYWLQLGYVMTSSIFYHRWFKQVPWDIEAWRFGEPGDYNRVRRLKALGMEYMHFDEPLIRKYYDENNMKLQNPF
jgi:glycosyltransferase involved in cell wall biosynthesis